MSREWARPIPGADGVSSTYWEAGARGELLFQQCPACGNRQLYPRALCTACGETPEWVQASGRGTVHTFTIIRQNYAKPFRDELPYVVAIVELEEGPRLMSNVTGVPADEVSIGLPVEVYFEVAAEGIGVPFFRPI
ncbi:MAG: Zn-ribbon OB-fold protein [Acidimicrobiales bacterium]|nr:Zn-ribbon OB-fold protein [Acidimicrobiales bacterium]